MDTMDKKLIALQQEIKMNIEVYGWHVVKVDDDAVGPSYGYSIGLFEKFNHPEIIIIGPEVDIIHFLINQIGESVMKGVIFQPAYSYSTFIEGAYLRFATVDKKYYPTYVEHAKDYYTNNAFPLLQCLYPDPKGIYPDQATWPEILNAIQPYLGSITNSSTTKRKIHAISTGLLPIISIGT
jgi:hypothetical protein